MSNFYTKGKPPRYWTKAKKILSKKDKVMKKLINNYKDGNLITRNDVFFSLCKSIIGQQISVAAANSVFLNFNHLSEQLFVQSFLLIFLSIIFYNSSLILSFGIYFVFWHSIPSIIEQSQYIYGSNSMTSFFNYFKSSFLYWILSLMGLLFLYYFLKDYQNLLISIFFSFLAAITFPHTLVIFKMKNN